MGYLEELHARRWPVFRGITRWVSSATFVVGLVVAGLLMRGGPDLHRLRIAQVVLVITCLIQVGLPLIVLLKVSAWQRLVVPSIDRRWARRQLWIRAVSFSAITVLVIMAPVP